MSFLSDQSLLRVPKNQLISLYETKIDPLTFRYPKRKEAYMDGMSGPFIIYDSINNNGKITIEAIRSFSLRGPL